MYPYSKESLGPEALVYQYYHRSEEPQCTRNSKLATWLKNKPPTQPLVFEYYHGLTQRPRRGDQYDSYNQCRIDKERLVSWIQNYELILLQRCPLLFQSELELKRLNDKEIDLERKIYQMKRTVFQERKSLAIMTEQFESFEFETI